MSSSFSKFGSWLVRKFLMVAVMTVAGFATYGLLLFSQDQGSYESNPPVLSARREHLQTKIAALEKQAADLDAGIATQEQRLVMAGRVIKTLRELDNTWDRLIWNRGQQRAYDERSARMRVVIKSAEAERVSLRHERILSERSHYEAEKELARVERALVDRDHGVLVGRHYLNEAWHEGRCYVLLVVAAYLFGPTLVLLGLYYGLAPFVVRRKPMRLGGVQAAASTASVGMTTVENAVWPGEILLVKKKFIETADADLVRKTRAVLSWRFPLASLAGGLFNLAEVRNVRNAGGRRITLAGTAKAAVEFAVIEVPEGGSLVVRPGFLAGVLKPAGGALRILRLPRIGGHRHPRKG